MTPRKTTHGGARKNAGRKAVVDRPHAVSVKLSDAELSWLMSCGYALRASEQHDVSRAEILRRALEQYRP